MFFYFRVHIRYCLILMLMFIVTWLVGVLLLTYYWKALLCILFIICCIITVSLQQLVYKFMGSHFACLQYFLRVVFLKMHLPPENLTITLYAHPIIGYQLQTFGMLYEVCLLLRNNNAISNLKSLFCPTPKNPIKNSLSLPLDLICGITMAPITYHQWNVN